MDEAPNALDYFDLASDETRVAVLRALEAAYDESPGDPWLSYSELREAVGVRDKGNFNYHLDRLGDLVETGDAGYRLSALGMEVATTVAAGDLNPDWTWGPVEVPGSCPRCDGALALEYADGHLSLECESGAHAYGIPGSPGLLDVDSEAGAVERVAVTLHQYVERVRRGICWDCDGVVERAVREEERGYYFDGDCRRCGHHHGLPVGLALAGHPAVVGFFDERGVDVRSVPPWTLDFCSPGREVVESTDPLRVRVDVERDGETLSFTVDRECSVVEVDRA